MIYCIIGEDLAPLVEKTFPEDDRIAIGDGRWLVRSDASTSMFVWNRLVGEDEPPTIGIVLAVHGYYGRHQSATWEWLAAKRQVGNGL